MFFINNTPAIPLTLIGLGQAGTRIVDLFAQLKKNGSYVYDCYALNSNDGDLQGLKHIDPKKRVSLKLGGFGKNPENAIKILEEDQEVKAALEDFLKNKVEVKEGKPVIFVAGIGGGTGTATIVKLVEMFNDIYNVNIYQEELMKIIQEVGMEYFQANQEECMERAYPNIQKRLTKIGIIATIPVRSDGPEVLRQSSNFANKLWQMSLDEDSNISFVHFPDNQLAYDEWSNDNLSFSDYREYANNKIFTAIHELNTAMTGGGTDVTMDVADFSRIVLEGKGCFVMNKVVKNNSEISSPNDLRDMLLEGVHGGTMHSPIQFEVESKDGNGKVIAPIHNMGLFSVISQDKETLGSSFLDVARDKISKEMFINGIIYTGYLKGRTKYENTSYVFYKVEALPDRLAKGLKQEFDEYMQRQRAVRFQSADIETIENQNAKKAMKLSDNMLKKLGLDKPTEQVAATDEKPTFDPSKIDLSSVDWKAFKGKK
ncbi:cell division protein FtsZ [Aneurinibacillus migulanus]|uniref:cell division protein FtsZ n=1 Tax=Aneurinibacillus migulanus TaxID=47500 RepID=UPI002E1D83C6|nr:cell division protein FtsZ [Aneurinibacillus migulanus]